MLDPSYVGDKSGLELNLFRGFLAQKLEQYDPLVIEPVLYHIRKRQYKDLYIHGFLGVSVQK